MRVQDILDRLKSKYQIGGRNPYTDIYSTSNQFNYIASSVPYLIQDFDKVNQQAELDFKDNKLNGEEIKDKRNQGYLQAGIFGTLGILEGLGNVNYNQKELERQQRANKPNYVQVPYDDRYNSYLEDNYKAYETGGIPNRYKEMGFDRVGQRKNSTREGKKWMILAKKGDQYKVVHGGDSSMQDYSQHKDEQRRKNFWSRMGKTTDKFSPRYWHNKLRTWEVAGQYGIDNISLQGYKETSPYKNEPQLTINSNNITMDNVKGNLLGIGNGGDVKIMNPNNQYNFPNSTQVKELPLFKYESGGDNEEDDSYGQYDYSSYESLDSIENNSESNDFWKKVSEENDLIFSTEDDFEYTRKVPNVNFKEIEEDYVKQTQTNNNGSIAVRHNNPGNIKYSEFSKQFGGIKGEYSEREKDGTYYTHFPTIEHGLAAQRGLLLSANYRDLTVPQALNRWAAGTYQNQSFINMFGNKKIKDLSDSELKTLQQEQIRNEDGNMYRQIYGQRNQIGGSFKGFDEKTLSQVQRFDEMYKYSGSPTLSKYPTDRSYYNAMDNSIHLGRQEDYIGELAHAYQRNNRKELGNNIYIDNKRNENVPTNPSYLLKGYDPLTVSNANSFDKRSLQMNGLYEEYLNDSLNKQYNTIFAGEDAIMNKVIDSQLYETEGSVEYNAHSYLEPKIKNYIKSGEWAAGGYLKNKTTYVRKDGVETKRGLWSNVYLKNKNQTGGKSKILLQELDDIMFDSNTAKKIGETERYNPILEVKAQDGNMYKVIRNDDGSYRWYDGKDRNSLPYRMVDTYEGMEQGTFKNTVGLLSGVDGYRKLLNTTEALGRDGFSVKGTLNTIKDAFFATPLITPFKGGVTKGLLGTVKKTNNVSKVLGNELATQQLGDLNSNYQMGGNHNTQFNPLTPYKPINRLDSLLNKMRNQSYIPNLQKIGNITFDSNKAINIGNYLKVKDINTNEDFVVQRLKDGEYQEIVFDTQLNDDKRRSY